MHFGFKTRLRIYKTYYLYFLLLLLFLNKFPLNFNLFRKKRVLGADEHEHKINTWVKPREEVVKK